MAILPTMLPTIPPTIPPTILLAVTAITLAACGGGGGGGGGRVETSGAQLQQYMQGPQTPSYALGLVGADATGGSGGYRGRGVKVAVIDGEFDVDHPDISGAFRRDANGHVSGRNVVEGHDDVRPVEKRIARPRSDITESLSAEDKRNEERDYEANFSREISHATHVTGIITARNNNFGTVGIAPEATVLPIVLFRDYYVPRKYQAWGSSDPRLPGWEASNRRVSEAVKQAQNGNAFVINNSWGRNRAPKQITFFNSQRRYLLPNYFLRDDPYSHADVFHANSRQAWEAAAGSGKVIVFSAGNSGWNSETGRVPIYNKAIDFDNKAANDPIDYRNTKGLFVRDKLGQNEEIPENIPSLESSYFLTSSLLRGRWLSVVNVTKQRVISRWSNGCGIAKNYCLAAPGTDIKSTFARGELEDDGDETGPNVDGDIDDKARDGYGTYSGTSMAAPVVSGALAVLKSKDPQLTARKAVKALLCTATELRESGRSIDPKPTDDAAIATCVATEDTGSGLTYTNGWTPSEVYGHGLVNLARALQPIGPTRAAAGDSFAVAPAADTRVAFSAAFGDSASSRGLSFGGFDSLGRVYRFRAPLQDRVMPGPRLHGVMAMNAPTPPVVMRNANGVTTLLRRSTDADSAIGEGGMVSYIGDRSRTDLTLVNRRTSGALSPAALLRPRHDVAPVWDGLAPRARDIFGAESVWRLSRNLRAGVFFSRASVAAATGQGGSYSLRDYGVSTRFGGQRDGVEARVGRMNESGRFLGSKPEGGYELARPTGSHYLRLRATRRLSPKLSIGAEWLRLRTSVDFRHDSFVRDMTLDARAAGLYLTARDLRRDGDRLVLHYGEPLAVTGGVMRQTSVTGYSDSGAYRATTAELDLAVRHRHRMTQVVYQRPLAGRMTGFAVVAHHENWSHRGGLTKNLVMIGVTLRR